VSGFADEVIEQEFVMRWMGLVIDDSYGNGMNNQEAAQAFRLMIAHLESHLGKADTTTAAQKTAPR
jgi:hypothetical protein